MIYNRLGKSGLKVSTLSFGAWVTFGTQMQLNAARSCMTSAYDAGVNFFDNAETYANGLAETIMGKVLKQTGWSRDSYIISSKVFFGSSPEHRPTQTGLHRKHIVEACHQILNRLQLDYLDLYFCHRLDPETPIEETVWTMNTLIQQGKILYWGTSEWPACSIMEAYSIAKQHHLIPPTMEQPQYNMLHREKVEVEYTQLYKSIGLGTTTWSPLASGFLTGKYINGTPAGSRLSLPGYAWLKKYIIEEQQPNTPSVLQKLSTLSSDLSVSLSALAIAWCAQNPNVHTVITGASNPDQVKQNMKAVDAIQKLTPEVNEKIEEILANKPHPHE